MSDKRRMDAYYYSFYETGCDLVDKILGAVACAGKAYHHTDQWNEKGFLRDDHSGEAPVDWIQNAAQEAADRIEELEAELTKAIEALEKLARLGSGQYYGNSDGNMIARSTLAELSSVSCANLKGETDE